jgi:hypothetical protein
MISRWSGVGAGRKHGMWAQGSAELVLQRGQPPRVEIGTPETHSGRKGGALPSMRGVLPWANLHSSLTVSYALVTTLCLCRDDCTYPSPCGAMAGCPAMPLSDGILMSAVSPHPANGLLPPGTHGDMSSLLLKFMPIGEHICTMSKYYGRCRPGRGPGIRTHFPPTHSFSYAWFWVSLAVWCFAHSSPLSREGIMRDPWCLLPPTVLIICSTWCNACSMLDT